MLPRGAAAAFVAGNAALALLRSSAALAEPRAAAYAEATRYELSVHGETHAELFRRALLPGANGVAVSTHTLLPLRQYVLVRARELDAELQGGALDFEIAAWGSTWVGEAGPERPVDGDVQTANVGYRRGPLALRLGRQQVSGGAARYARFDGLLFGADLGEGFDAEGYGGFTVLPRWDARPGYHYLGAPVDAELRSANALPPPERSSRWLAGGRLGWSASGNAVRVSFHEQHEERGLARRNLGVDARAPLLREALVGGSGLVELDAGRVADGRLYCDLTPIRDVLVSVEYLHTEPALFLSRESVLSVFSTDGYDEAGAFANARLDRVFALEGAGFAQFYSDGRPGARGEIAARVTAERGRPSLVRVAYARVLAPDNGYHSLRASLARRMLLWLSGTLEAYAYFYDEAIRGRRVSSVYAGTLTYQPSTSWSALWGASLAQSPYARFDAQTQLSLAYDFDFIVRRGSP